MYDNGPAKVHHNHGQSYVLLAKNQALCNNVKQPLFNILYIIVLNE